MKKIAAMVLAGVLAAVPVSTTGACLLYTSPLQQRIL